MSSACFRIQHLLSWPGPELAGAVRWALVGSGVLEGPGWGVAQQQDTENM